MSDQIEQNEVELQQGDSAQYLTFKLDGEAFATRIARVREVLELDEITRVPRTLEHMLGVINLRGSVVPVVDLRLQFGLATREPTVDTCIIIIEVEIDNASIVLGVLADSVQEVIDLRSDQMEPAPTMGTRINTDFIQAMGKLDEGFIILLNMDKVFSKDELEVIDDAECAAA